MIVKSYFSGGGLFDIGFNLAGIELEESFEIDAVCCKVQRENFSHKVTKVDLKSTTEGVINFPGEPGTLNLGF
jgi:DNA (cytosine-5)-methyltransferase 1